MLRVTTRNARFQQWQALLSNRAKRSRTGEFLVQGVRPISLAREYGWTIDTLIHPLDRPLSRWAAETIATAGEGRAGTGAAQSVAMAPELLAELTGKEDAELLAAVRMPADELTRIPVRPDLLVVVFDRPTSPGNIGTLIRSADVFGAHGVIITGHAADPYDPKAVRASTGSLFAVPTVRVPGPAEVLDWLAGLPVPAEVVLADEAGEHDLPGYDLTGPRVVLVGNETTGPSVAWRRAGHATVRIPMSGAASSLNAATAASVVLYEAARQRRVTRVPPR